MLLLKQAMRCCEEKDWVLGESLATEAIAHGIMLQAAHMVRASARRFQQKFDGAVSDYTEVLRLDPDNPDALMFRGATYMDWSSHEQDYQQAVNMISNLAILDFKRAAAVDPSHVGIELSVAEVLLCVANYREAVGTAGVCWTRAFRTSDKIVCAWLGAMALILAGKPERKWRHYADCLQNETGTLNGYWNGCSVERLLKHLAVSNIEGSRLEMSCAIHELFLAHDDRDG
jgi:hypothetical protein